MLFDPFEKQFHLPARLVEQADGERGQVEIVGEETEMAILFGIVIMDPSERIRVELPGGGSGRNDGVVGANPGRGVDVVRVSPAELNAFLGAREEEGAAAVEDVKTLEVYIGAIHYVERARLRHDGIEDIDVVQFSVGNLNKRGDRAAQVEQGVHLDGGLLGSKPGPREH